MALAAGVGVGGLVEERWYWEEEPGKRGFDDEGERSAGRWTLKLDRVTVQWAPDSDGGGQGTREGDRNRATVH
ncbi:hypothetical protein ColTof4_04394 [Colletotrichum tofieldiae]|nr:hypothetical protein ColTof3_11397 [Colletotrichum tofieldiae]GKT71971.1 hypothetical protein ColTof4_04394 [Colletotrichum tofieldiae]